MRKHLTLYFSIMHFSKKHCWIGCSAIIICALVALIAWWLWPKNYADMIPAQAKAVVRIVPSELANSPLKNVNPIEKALGLKPDGIDLKSPVYAFVTPNEYIGFTAKVEDKDAVINQINKLVKLKKCAPIEYIDGQAWIWINAGWLATCTDNTLLILGPGVAQERDVLRQTMTTMINTGDTFTSTDNFKKLKEQTGGIQLFAQLDAMPTPYNLLFRLAIPADCDPAAVNVFATANIKQNEAKQCVTTITSTLTSENDDILAAIDQYEREKGCISLPTTSEQQAPLFALSTRTQGKPLLKLLKTDATLRGLLMGLNQTFDADQMLGSTDGLFSIEIDSLAGDWTPIYCMKTETQAKNLFDNADYWMECAKKQKNVTLKRISPNAFVLNSDKQQLHFGLNAANTALYFASATMLPKAEMPFNVTKTDSKEGVLVYFNLNLKKFFQQPCVKSKGASSLIQMLIPGSKRVCYQATTGRKATLTIE